MRTSSPRSTSCSLPDIVGRSPGCLRDDDAFVVAFNDDEPDSCDNPAAAAAASFAALSAAYRLANSDSMYSSLA